MRTLLEEREYIAAGIREHFLEIRCLIGGNEWKVFYCRWVPAAKEETPAEESEDEEAEAEGAEGAAQKRKKRKSRIHKGSWEETAPIPGTPGTETEGALIHSLYPSPAARQDKDLLFQVIHDKKAEPFPPELLKLLNTHPFHPFNVGYELFAKSPVQIGELFVLRRRKYVSPAGNYSVVIQNVVRHNGVNIPRPRGTSVSIISEKGISAADIVNASRRIRDLLSIVKAKATAEGAQQSGAPMNAQNAGNRGAPKKGRPRDEAPALAPVSNVELSGMSNEQLKQLWQKHKRQTERIHAAWIKALNK